VARSSRKRRRQRPAADRRGAGPGPAGGPAAVRRGYARSRERDEAARAALEPLAEGERPTAVTVGSIAAGCLSVANLVALLLAFDPDEPDKALGAAFGAIVLAVVAAGMWRARYWAVLGMQTILLIAIVFASVALVTAGNLAAVLLVLAIVVPSGTLFWFLVKAMARIQMPERPGSRRPPV
jgi:hypothetical protein